MDPLDRDILAAAIDRAMEELQADDAPAFADEGPLRGAVFGVIRRSSRRWRQRHQCVFPGCDRQSIRASHTIQEAALHLIAEDNHVLTPGMDYGSNQTVMRRVGVGEASVFPGFCESHESIFRVFEEAGELRTERDIELQLFRTICRELVIIVMISVFITR